MGLDLTIVGNAGGTNVGASLERAAVKSGRTCLLCDARAATAGPKVAVTASWRLLGHRPLHLGKFSRSVVEECRRERPRLLIATGQAPVDSAALKEIGEMGIVRVNYSTDDPWNPAHRAAWFLEALPHYDRVRSTRRANLEDFRRQGCRDAAWLPFGYDADLWTNAVNGDPQAAEADIFFAGAAEKYRIEVVRALSAAGLKVAVAGDYWKRTADLRKCWVGHLPAEQLAAWTRRTPIALCLARRANRDGHVMRSIEIPAIGACMLAEDTAEHREIFGEDGAAVRYFGSPAAAVAAAQELLGDERRIGELARAANDLITGSRNSYGDRLAELAAPELAS